MINRMLVAVASASFAAAIHADPLLQPPATLAASPPYLSRQEEEPAKSRPHVYARVFGGWGQLQDDDLEFEDGFSGVSNGDVSFDAGIQAGVALGWRFNRRWALEAEYGYRTNDLDAFEASGATIADGGEVTSTSVLLNLLYSFDREWRIAPYVGLGVGFASDLEVEWERAGFSGEQAFSGDSLAAQVLVGLESRVNSRWSVFLEGRYYQAFDVDLDGDDNPGSVDTDYGHYGLVMGVSLSL